MTKLHTQFIQNGWLLIAFFPAIQLIQRTPLAIATLLYLLWAVWSLAKTPQKKPLPLFYLGCYAAIIITFSFSILIAHEPSLGFSKWLQYFAYSSAFPVILLTLQYNNIERLTHFLGISGLLSLIILFVKLVYFYFFAADFQPRFQMQENILPLLAPFLLYWALYIQTKLPAKYFALALYISMLAYIVISQGRAALLAYIIASFLFGSLVLFWRLRYVMLGIITIFFISVALSGSLFFRGLSAEDSIAKSLDHFTSNRSIIWRQAIQNPPDNIWLGYGMGHVQAHTEILQVHVNGFTDRYKHLHNFLLDVSYETGLLGLVSLLFFLWVILFRTLKCWCRSPPLIQQQLGLYFAASCAILAASLLNLAYDSKPFNLYLFMLLAGLAHIILNHTKANTTS